jgi:hypothetical protein
MFLRSARGDTSMCGWLMYMHISYLGHNLILKTRTKLHADVAGLEIFAALQEGGSSPTQLCSSHPSTFMYSLTQFCYFIIPTLPWVPQHNFVSFSSRHFYFTHTILLLFPPNTFMSSLTQLCSSHPITFLSSLTIFCSFFISSIYVFTIHSHNFALFSPQHFYEFPHTILLLFIPSLLWVPSHNFAVFSSHYFYEFPHTTLIFFHPSTFTSFLTQFCSFFIPALLWDTSHKFFQFFHPNTFMRNLTQFFPIFSSHQFYEIPHTIFSNFFIPTLLWVPHTTFYNFFIAALL